ncbi:hypothetical protein GA0115246_102891, partial [Streptomyces sp. SolWspMP-sol7th]
RGPRRRTGPAGADRAWRAAGGRSRGRPGFSKARVLGEGSAGAAGAAGATRLARGRTVARAGLRSPLRALGRSGRCGRGGGYLVALVLGAHGLSLLGHGGPTVCTGPTSGCPAASRRTVHPPGAGAPVVVSRSLRTIVVHSRSSAVSFSHRTSGHCKPTLCVRVMSIITASTPFGPADSLREPDWSAPRKTPDVHPYAPIKHPRTPPARAPCQAPHRARTRPVHPADRPWRGHPRERSTGACAKERRYPRPPRVPRGGGGCDGSMAA